MTTSTSRSQIAENADLPSTPDTSLRGRRLVIARVVWLAIAISFLLLFVLALPLYAKFLETVCMGASCPAGQVSLQTARTLQRIGISLDTYTIVNVTLTVIFALLWMGVGLLMFWRKSSDWMVLIFSLWFMTEILSIENVSLAGFQQVPAPFTNILDTSLLVSNTLNTSLVFLVFALFPNGRFAPRWMRWVAFLAIALYIAGSIADSLISQWESHTILGSVFFFLFAGSLLAGQIYRYRHISTALERQQTKWVVSSIVVTILLQIGISLPLFISPSFRQPGSLYPTAQNLLGTLFLLIIPPSIAIAMLRYRLWDIDVIINRTLVYVLLTGILALLYFGSVLGLQFLFDHLMGPTAANSPIILVGSTLLIAALFRPLRSRIQSIIDRRFYRRKYDAKRTVANFSATLRGEVDLVQLSEQLVEVVEETMQPAHVSLWLNKPHQSQPGYCKQEDLPFLQTS